MIIYELECPLQHRFEGWFQNANAFEDQQAAGLIQCAVCGASDVTRRPSGGHIQRSSTATFSPCAPQAAEESAPAAEQTKDIAVDPVMLTKAIRYFVKEHGKNVGKKFTEQAIKMHNEESSPEPIYGSASSEDRDKLDEMGVAYMPFPDLPEQFEQ